MVHSAGSFHICLPRAGFQPPGNYWGQDPHQGGPCPLGEGFEDQFTWRVLQWLLSPLTQHIEEYSSEDENDGQEGQHWHYHWYLSCRTHIFFLLLLVLPSLQTVAHRGSTGFIGVGEVFVQGQSSCWKGGLLGRRQQVGWQVPLGRGAHIRRWPFCELRNLGARGR